MNTVYIENRLTEAQRAEILAIIDEHNMNLFDGNDYISEEIVEGAEFTCIEGDIDESDSLYVIETYRHIVAVIDGENDRQKIYEEFEQSFYED